MISTNPLPRIAMFGDLPPRPTFRKFRKERNALKFAIRMDTAGRLFKPSEPVVKQTFGNDTFFFVNYRRKY